MRGAMPRAGAAGRSARGARPLDVAERPADPGEVLAVGACHRIDEVVEALSSRVGLERKIACASEEYPVPREAPRSAWQAEEALRDQAPLDLGRATHDGLGARVEVGARAAAPLDRMSARHDRAVGAEDVEGELLEVLVGLAAEHLLDRALRAGLAGIAEQAGEAPIAGEAKELDVDPDLGHPRAQTGG